MEEEGVLDPLSETHLAALHYMFLPLINVKLDTWREAWAHHRMRTTRSTPAQLSGQHNNPVGLDNPTTLSQDPASIDDENEEQAEGLRPVILLLLSALPEACLLELNTTSEL